MRLCLLNFEDHDTPVLKPGFTALPVFKPGPTTPLVSILGPPQFSNQDIPSFSNHGRTLDTPCCFRQKINSSELYTCIHTHKHTQNTKYTQIHTNTHTHTDLLLLLLLNLLHEDAPLLVLASFVLEPDPDDPRIQSSHLDELFLHQGVRSGVRRVACSQGVQLFLVKHGSHPRRLLVRLVGPRTTVSTLTRGRVGWGDDPVWSRGGAHCRRIDGRWKIMSMLLSGFY